MKEIKNYTRPLWFWNNKPTKEGLTEIMENCKNKDKYAGFGILAFDKCDLKYLGEEYLDLYGHVLKEAKRLNLKICLYDEWWFPSGYAGGILKEKYPEALAKRLDLEEFDFDGKTIKVKLPTDGKIMAVVALKDTVRINLAPFVKDGVLEYTAEDNGFKALCFILREADWDHVDFLSQDAVKKFIECIHEVYYQRFSEYFGDVIDSSFYDEPQFYGALGRMWTEKFNERFLAKYGEDPAIYYPALFYDIGEDTTFARTALLSIRADLYSESFPKTVQKWCTDHGIALTGHVDQEEVVNPCGMTGDLIKSFKYQDIPGIDEIIVKDRATKAYKIVSSSAVNYNKSLVMCECFGAFNDIDEDIIYHESYDMFTKGVNHFVPHAVWYDTNENRIVFKPELSYRHEYFSKVLPKYNEYYSTVANYLQPAKQVNTVGMIYPIESLESEYTLNWGGDPYLGGPASKTDDYMDIGQFLSRSANIDYNFIHPEVLSENGRVESGILSLNNTEHIQNYKVIIMPGMKAVSVETMKILKEFVLSGGTLISINELPKLSSEKGKDQEVRDIVYELFGVNEIIGLTKKILGDSGKCYAIPSQNLEEIRNIILSEKIDTSILSNNYGLQYIHKKNKIEKFDVWYFANLGEDFSSKVVLDGIFNLTAIDPKTNEETVIKATYKENTTEFDFSIKKLQSLLVIGK